SPVRLLSPPDCDRRSIHRVGFDGAQITKRYFLAAVEMMYILGDNRRERQRLPRPRRRPLLRRTSPGCRSADSESVWPWAGSAFRSCRPMRTAWSPSGTRLAFKEGL